MADWDQFMARETILMDEYRPLDHAEKMRCFSFTGAAGIEQVKFVHRQLIESLREGGTFRSFKKAVRSGDLAVDLPDHRLETIFRTNVLHAYGRGRYLEHQETADVWPWLMYETADDDRVRPNHWALHQVTVKVGSAEADRIYPPNGYNCRCNFRQLTEAEAESERRYSESEVRAIIAANPPDAGFAGPPFEGGSAAKAVPIDLRGLYEGETVPDDQFKALLEAAEAKPEAAAALPEGIVNEGLVTMTDDFVKEVGGKTLEAWEAEEKAEAAQGLDDPASKAEAAEAKAAEKTITAMDWIDFIFGEKLSPAQIEKLAALDPSPEELWELSKTPPFDGDAIPSTRSAAKVVREKRTERKRDVAVPVTEDQVIRRNEAEKVEIRETALRQINARLGLDLKNQDELDDKIYELLTTDIDKQMRLRQQGGHVLPHHAERLKTRAYYEDPHNNAENLYQHLEKAVINSIRTGKGPTNIEEAAMHYTNQEISALSVHNLPKSLQAAAASYTSDAKDALLNSTMRGTVDSQAARDLVKVIDVAIEAAQRPDRVEQTLYRGIGKTADVLDRRTGRAMTDLKPGDRFVNRSLLSFSESRDVAVGFVKGRGVVWEVTSRKGLPLSALANFPFEREHLFKSDSKFVVAGIERGEFGTITIKLAELPDDADVDLEFSLGPPDRGTGAPTGGRTPWGSAPPRRSPRP